MLRAQVNVRSNVQYYLCRSQMQGAPSPGPVPGCGWLKTCIVFNNFHSVIGAVSDSFVGSVWMHQIKIPFRVMSMQESLLLFALGHSCQAPIPIPHQKQMERTSKWLWILIRFQTYKTLTTPNTFHTPSSWFMPWHQTDRRNSEKTKHETEQRRRKKRKI